MKRIRTAKLFLTIVGADALSAPRSEATSVLFLSLFPKFLAANRRHRALRAQPRTNASGRMHVPAVRFPLRTDSNEPEYP